MHDTTKRILTALISMSLAFSLASPALAASASPYSDVSASHWAYSSILDAYHDKVMQGTAEDDGTGKSVFSPDKSLTMAEFIAVLTRAFYSEDVEAAVGETDDWWAKNDAVAEREELYEGIPARSMTANVSRAQMAVIIVNVLRDKGATLPSSADLNETMGKIPDLSTAYPAFIDQIAICYYFGILQGVDEEGDFAPNDTVSRAVAATIYVRIRDAVAGIDDPEALSAPTSPSPDPIDGQIALPVENVPVEIM